MNWPTGPGFPVDPVIRTLMQVIKKDDWTRIDAAWERIRIPLGIHLRRDAALDVYVFLLDALLEVQRHGIMLAFVRELICEDLLTDGDVHRISDLPGGPGSCRRSRMAYSAPLMPSWKARTCWPHAITCAGSTSTVNTWVPACRSPRTWSRPRRTS